MAQRRKKRVTLNRVAEPQARRPGWLWWVGAVALVVVLVGVGWMAFWSPRAAASKITTVEQVKRISAGDAKALLDSGQALVYDTRSAESYQAKHIPNALSVPEADVTQVVNTFPKDKILIFYCT